MKIHCMLLNMKALLEVFPDAQLIMVHRELEQMVRMHIAKNPFCDRDMKFPVISADVFMYVRMFSNFAFPA